MTAGASTFLLLIGSYLFGSVSSAILITRLWTGKDIRTLGNRNAGAANVGRSVGIFPAALVTIIDFSKGAIPVMLARYWKLGDMWALAGASAAALGHSYPIYFRFRGGKGLAVSLGALLAFTPLETFITLPVLGLVYLVITGSAVTGALVSLAILIGLNIWSGRSLIIILAPLALLFVMGLCSLPEAIPAWRKRDDKGRLIVQWLHPKDSLESNHIAIVTDSVASLPQELCRRENIHVVPLTLVLPDKTYQDGVDIDTREFYRWLRERELSPKTSAPSPGEYLTLFKQLAKKHKVALVLTPAKELTQVWDSARLAREQAPKTLEIHVIDTRTAGPAQGFAVLSAARAKSAGLSPEEILKAIQTAQANVGLIGVLDTLKFLVEGGRVQDAHRWVKSALHVYPMITLTGGLIRLAGLSRSKKKAVNRTRRWLEDHLPPGAAALAYFHTDAHEEIQALSNQLETVLQPTESFITELTPVLGAHAGPGIVGVAWWMNPEKMILTP
ncbi:MAG: DegV family EDD domain-containing protein [Chloroflexi bacterium]|nr:DegV family EDD domain-containing protein [Chloroflexota bacterium]